MATVQKVYKQSKKGSGSGGATGTITGSSTLEANYVVSETDETFIITQTSHSYSTPTYSGSTGSAAEDVLFKTTFLTKAMLLSDLSINGTTCSDNTPITFNKTHSTQTLNLSLGDSIVATLTIPAKTKYTITLKDFDDTQIGTLTKWYNEDLTLPIATVTGYDFLGWADSSAKATTGQVDYAVGVQYTANAGATLYASCELAYTKPVISNLSVERCKADGTLLDEGRYAKVKFNWSVYRSAEAQYFGGDTYPYANNGSTASVTVGTYTATDTSTDASGTYEIVVGNGNLDEDEQYEVVAVLSDTQTVKPDNTDTEAGLLTTSYFPIDFNRIGTAMGIFRPAPDDEEGVFLGKGLSVKGNVVATGDIQGENVTANGNLQGQDTSLELDTTETVDADINSALTSLEWTDVLSSGKLLLKALLAKILDRFNNAVFYGAPTGSSLADKSLTSGTSWQNLGSITLPRGLWEVRATVIFPSNATGRRCATLSTSTGGGAALSVATSQAVNGYSTHLQMHITQYFNGSTPLYINAVQNSGSTLTVSTRYTAQRLAMGNIRID